MHPGTVTIGVLALQGAFSEHIQLLRAAASAYPEQTFEIAEVRTREQLGRCDALVIPGGESTAISLVAERGGMLGGLREFVK
jgi:5'-phosphate synthase pdxT subunit